MAGLLRLFLWGILLIVSVSCSEGTPTVELLDVAFEEPKLIKSEYIITNLDDDILIQGSCDPRTDGFLVQWSQDKNWEAISIICKLRNYAYTFQNIGYSLNFNYGFADTKTFTLKALGAKGKESNTLVTIKYEPSDIPIVTLNDPGSITILNHTSFDISGTCSHNGEDVAVTLKDSSVNELSFAAPCVATGWSLTGIDVSSLNDGSVDISAEHLTAIPVGLTVNKDTSIDAVNISSPTALDYINQSNKSTFTISGTCSANSSSVDITVDDTNGSILPVTGSDTCTSNTFSKTVDLSSLDDDIITISVTHGSSPGDSVSLVKDTSVPTVTGVTLTNADGTYGVGTVLTVQVNFSEAVDVSLGAPRILLDFIGTDRYADYSTGSGTSTLEFNYTIVSGDNATDIDYVGTASLELNGSLIKDGSLNSATLTLASPGTAGSISNVKDVNIDTSVPTVTGVTLTNADGTYGVGTVL
ncbi:MAG: hypothetical protein KDD58_08050, partial [Bdellovibrionales bacterium]|nr:hypothetical protein [Bdellovibrionales bacterium]